MTTDKRSAATSRSAAWPASEETTIRWPGTTTLKTSTSPALPALLRSMFPLTTAAGGVPVHASSWAWAGVLLGSCSAAGGDPPASLGRCMTTTAAASPRTKCGARRQERPARAASRAMTVLIRPRPRPRPSAALGGLRTGRALPGSHGRRSPMSGEFMAPRRCGAGCRRETPPQRPPPRQPSLRHASSTQRFPCAGEPLPASRRRRETPVCETSPCRWT